MKLRTGKPEEAGMSPQHVQHFLSLAQGWMDEGGHPELVWVVARRGVIVAYEAHDKPTPSCVNQHD